MIRKLISLLLGFVLTHCVILAAVAFGGSFSPGAGAIIGFSVGFSRIYTRDNSMLSLSCWCLLMSCMLGGISASYRI